MRAAETFVRQIWAPLLAQDVAVPADPKSVLQEWAQARGLPLPHYELQTRRGPDHAPEFVMQVRIEGYPAAMGVAATKQLGQKAAAEALLALLNK
jgi:ribonuclease-3